MNQNIVLGVPIFSNSPTSTLQSPLGQLELCRAVRQETNDFAEVTRMQLKEYLGIAWTLQHMGIVFKILMPETQLIEQFVRQLISQEKFDTLPFPAVTDMAALMFPRDLAMMLPNGTVLIDSVLGKEPWLKGIADRVCLSPYGQGGRLLLSSTRALVTEYWYWNQDPRHEMKPTVKPLEEAGLRVGLVPNAGMVESNGRQAMYGNDDHLDRSAGLLRDQSDRLHLIVDPRFWGGCPRSKHRPTREPRQTLRRILAVCHELGITLHVPRKMSVPGAVNFNQFPSRQVLMTSGDDEVAGIVSDIVGSNNVYVTPIPIRYFPAWGKGGIRCLIGEWPDFLCTLPVS